MKKLLILLSLCNASLYCPNQRTRARQRLQKQKLAVIEAMQKEQALATARMSRILFDGRPWGYESRFCDDKTLGMGFYRAYIGAKAFTDEQKQEIRAYVQQYPTQFRTIVRQIGDSKYTFLDHARVLGEDGAWQKEMESLWAYCIGEEQKK